MLRRAKKRSKNAVEEATSVAKSSRSKKTVSLNMPPALGDVHREDAEEERLANAVLGGEHIVVESVLDHRKYGKSDGSDSEDSEDDEDGAEDDVNMATDKVGVLDKERIKPAWEDDDDEQIRVTEESKGHHSAVWKTYDETKVIGKELKKRLKSNFEKTVGSTPSWAQLKSEKKKQKKTDSSEDSESDSDEDENQFLRKTGDYLTSSQQLPKNSLNYQKLGNANKERPTEGRVSSVQFHPSSQVILTAGEDQNLILFQVDGKHNPMIQTVHMERFPISRAMFSADGMQVIMTSRYKHFYVYDMIAGNITRIPNIQGTQEQRMMKFEVSPDGQFLAFIGSYGYIYLLSAKNKEFIDVLKMNGTVSAMSFTPDGSRLLTVGGDGEVYVWDIKSRNCIHKFTDEGCINGTSIAVARNCQYIACGCDSGVVNIYDQSCLTQTNPKPLKSIMNMVTAATSTKFNHNNEVLAISSRFTQNACKLVHLPSYQVFPNFPAFNEKMGCADCVDISPHSGYLTIGTSKGEALLYRLKHYTDY